MSWQINDKEFESVTALPASGRYSYWIKKVADRAEIWGLWRDGNWALASDDQGRQLVPVWPHERYAAASATGQWSGYEPRSIPISVWMGRWIAGMKRDGRLTAVFPTPGDRGIPRTPEDLERDLRSELALYE